MSSSNAFWRSLCLVLVFAGIAVLYVTQLSRTPAYLSIEEVGESYHALTFARTGRSTNGERWPLYFGSAQLGAGQGDPGRDPFLIYVRAAVLKVAPFSEAIVRLPSAAAGILDTILIFFIARRLFASERLGIVAAVILALTPAHFFHSRIATQQIGVLPFVLTWMLCLMKYLDNRQARYLMCATAALGAGTYVYVTSYVVMPVFLLLTLIVVMMDGRSMRLVSIAIMGFLVALVPAVAWNLLHLARLPDLINYYTHNGYNSDLGKQSATATFVGRLDAWWSAFSPDKMFLTGDSSLRFSTRQAGYFLLPMAILIPAGAFQLKRIEKPELRFLILAALVLGPLPAVAVRDYEIKRWLAFVPFAALAATAAIGAAFESGKTAWRLGVIVLVLLGVSEFVGFYRFYRGPYTVYSSFYFGRNLRGAIDEVLSTTSDPACALLDERVQYLPEHLDLYALARRREAFVGHGHFVDAERADFAPPATCRSASLLVYDGEVAANRALAQRLSSQGWRRTPIPEPDGTVYLSVYHLSK